MASDEPTSANIQHTVLAEHNNGDVLDAMVVDANGTAVADAGGAMVVDADGVVVIDEDAMPIAAVDYR